MVNNVDEALTFRKIMYFARTKPINSNFYPCGWNPDSADPIDYGINLALKENTGNQNVTDNEKVYLRYWVMKNVRPTAKSGKSLAFISSSFTRKFMVFKSKLTWTKRTFESFYPKKITIHNIDEK